MTTTNNLSNDFGDFGDEDIQTMTALPFAQYLAKADPLRIKGEWREVYGFAITAENAECVDFTADERWELVDFPFRQEITPVFVSKNPRILVLAKSQLHMQLKNSDLSPVPFDGNLYNSDKTSYQLMSRYAIAFIDGHGKLLHESPLRIKLKGCVGAQFARYYGWRGVDGKFNATEQPPFCTALAQFAKQEQNPAWARKSRYYAQMAFEPIIKVEQRGQGQNVANLGCIVGYKSGNPLKDWRIAESDRPKLDEFLNIVSGWNLNFSKSETSEFGEFGENEFGETWD